MALLQSMRWIFWNQEENRLRMVWRLVVYSSLLSILIGLSSAVLGISNILSDTYSLSLIVLLSVLISTLVVGKWVDRRNINDFGLMPSKAWWKDFFFGLILGAVLLGMIFIVGWISGSVTVNGYFQGTSQNGSFLTQFLKVVMFYFFVGIYEEVMLRGYILINLAEGLKIKNLDKKWSLILALLLSSLIFGLLHIVNPNASWISTLSISLAGIFLGLGMVLTGRLGLPIGLHITWNLFQGNVFGFPVSGTSFGVRLIATDLTGPDWLTGGAFGPEAGVLGLMAMLLGILLILLWVNRKGKLALKKALTDYQPVSKKR